MDIENVRILSEETITSTKYVESTAVGLAPIRIENVDTYESYFHSQNELHPPMMGDVFSHAFAFGFLNGAWSRGVSFSPAQKWHSRDWQADVSGAFAGNLPCSPQTDRKWCQKPTRYLQRTRMSACPSDHRTNWHFTWTEASVALCKTNVLLAPHISVV